MRNQREYKSFRARKDSTPRVRGNRDTSTTRDRITRPVGATPRNAKDWR